MKNNSNSNKSTSNDTSLREALFRWAIPEEFGRDIAFVLLFDLPMKEREHIWQEFARLDSQRALIYVEQKSNGKWSCSSDWRKKAMSEWHSNIESEKLFRRLNSLIHQYYLKAWEKKRHQTTKNSNFDPRFHQATSSFSLLERSLYHHFVADTNTAFTRFCQLFETYESSKASSACSRLLSVIRDFELNLKSEQKLFLKYFDSSVIGLKRRMGRMPIKEVASRRSHEKDKLQDLIASLTSRKKLSLELERLSGKVYFRLGRITFETGCYDDSFDNFSAAIDCFCRSQSLSEEISASNDLGLVLIRQEKIEQAIEHFSGLLKRLKGIAPTRHYAIGVILLNFANAYTNLEARRENHGTLEESARQFHHETKNIFDEARKAFESCKSAIGQGLLNASLGRWRLLRREYELAIEAFEIALQIFPRVSREYRDVRELRNIARELAKAIPREDPPKITYEPKDYSIISIMELISQEHRLFGEQSFYKHTKDYISKSVGTRLLTAIDPLYKNVESLDMGIQEFMRGRLKFAIECFENGLRYAQRNNNPEIELECLSWLSYVCILVPEYDKAISYSIQLLRTARMAKKYSFLAIGNLRFCEAVSNDLTNRWPEIQTILKTGINTARDYGNSFIEMACLAKLGEYSLRLGDFQGAYKWLDRALSLTESGDDPVYRSYSEISVHLAISEVNQRTGSLDKAARHVNSALEQAHRFNNPYFIAEAELVLAQNSWIAGHCEDAMTKVKWIRNLATQMMWPGIEQRVLSLMSSFYTDQRRYQDAGRYVIESLKISRSKEMKEEEFLCLKNRVLMFQCSHADKTRR